MQSKKYTEYGWGGVMYHFKIRHLKAVFMRLNERQGVIPCHIRYEITNRIQH